MSYITVVTPPSVLPVSLPEIKLHLSLNPDATYSDAQLTNFIKAAAERFESESGLILTATTCRLWMNDWTTSRMIRIAHRPVTAVSTVEYLSEAGTWTTIDDENYYTDLNAAPARIVFDPSYTMPTLLNVEGIPRVRVQFVAGQALAANVPDGAKVCVMLGAGHWFKNREAFADLELKPVPMGWDALVRQYWNGIIEEQNV